MRDRPARCTADGAHTRGANEGSSPASTANGYYVREVSRERLIAAPALGLVFAPLLCGCERLTKASEGEQGSCAVARTRQVCRSCLVVHE